MSLTLSGSRMLRCTRQTINFTVMSMGTPSGMLQLTFSPALDETDRQKAVLHASLGSRTNEATTPSILCKISITSFRTKDSIVNSNLTNSIARFLYFLQSVSKERRKEGWIYETQQNILNNKRTTISIIKTRT